MIIEQITWLRERVVTNRQGEDTLAMEFSCDSGYGRTPQFFTVKVEDLREARLLYRAWGGDRPEGYRVGTTVKGPGKPRTPSIRIWRHNGTY